MHEARADIQRVENGTRRTRRRRTPEQWAILLRSRAVSRIKDALNLALPQPIQRTIAVEREMRARQPDGFGIGGHLQGTQEL